MDIASLIGLVGTLGMIAGAMVSSGGIGPFIDTPSMLIVIGGTFFAVMYRSTLPDFLASFGTLVKVFLPGAKKHDELITRITELAGIARKDGMMALEGQEVPDKFFEKGLQMLVDGADETKLTEQLNREVKGMIRRHDNMKSVFQAWVDLAPAMGMIGTCASIASMKPPFLKDRMHPSWERVPSGKTNTVLPSAIFCAASCRLAIAWAGSERSTAI